MRIILVLILLLNSFGVMAASTEQCKQLALQMRGGRFPASAPRCETAGQLMSSKISGKDFTSVCRKIVDQDEGCKKLKPEKRMSCNAKSENEILSKADFLNKAGQCIKGFAWDSMVDLGKFVIELI